MTRRIVLAIAFAFAGGSGCAAGDSYYLMLTIGRENVSASAGAQEQTEESADDDEEEPGTIFGCPEEECRVWREWEVEPATRARNRAI